MSIIQKIRDKAAWIIIGAIALALIAFIVQDAFQNRNMFSGSTTTIGKINDTEISAVEFEERVKTAEEIYRMRGYPMNEMMRNNIRESLWNEYVEDAIMKDRYENLGIEVSDKELNDILFGANPPQDLKQQFTDPNTGQYDPNAAYQQIQTLKKQKNNPKFAAQYASFFEQYLPALKKSRQKEKYLALLSNTAYTPKWLSERNNADKSQKAAIAYVSVPYNSISDSAVKVTDAAIKSYVEKHKDQYQQEESRSIQYVLFDAGPTGADSTAIQNQVQALKSEFANAADVQAFLVRNGSEKQYNDAFELKSKMTSTIKDSLTGLADGQVYGPYIEEGNYVLAKMVARRTLPDSVKCRHILIKTFDREAGQVLADSTAKNRIDSIAAAIKGGANFNDMVAKYSDDEGSKDKGGEYEFSSSQFTGISKEFAETIFYGSAGDKKVVNVANGAYAGYHYIEVLSQKNFEPAYKIAEFARAIVPSDETTTRENGLAAQFAAESRTKKDFEANAAKSKYPVLVATDLKPLDAMIMGVGSSRELLRWVYNAEPGDIAEQPFQVEDKFVVPMLVKVYEEGTMPVEKARPLVEGILRNQEKAKQIVAKIKSATTLEAVASATSQQVATADSIMFSSNFIPNVGMEPKVIGASFNKENQSRISTPIEGNGGVYVVKVNTISAVPLAASSEPDMNQLSPEMMQNPYFQQMQGMGGMQGQQKAFSDPRVVIDILKKDAKIKDNRRKFF